MQADRTSALPGLGAGVMIETDSGPLPVDWLRAGDRVLTRDHGFRRLLWTGRSRWQGMPAPMAIHPDSFGNRSPERRLVLSPAHRVLLGAPSVELHFATAEVFAPAEALALQADLARDLPADFAYYNLLLADHAAVLAEGIWLESLLPDAATLAALGPAAAAEVAALPGTEQMLAARLCITTHEAQVLHPRRIVSARRRAA